MYYNTVVGGVIMNKNDFSTHITLKNVAVKDKFWIHMQALVRDHVLPYQYEALHDRIAQAEKSNCIENFHKAATIAKKRKNGEPVPVYPTDKWYYDETNAEPAAFHGWVFQDSDAYKWLEAVAYALVNQWDDGLYTKAKDLIDLICAAQLENGYLDTLYIINNPDKIFTNLKDFHELYCFGHLTEAAVAFYTATGEKTLLDAACRFADLLCETFGADKRRGYGGHEIAELALVKLYDVTENKKYLELAAFFINARGTKPFYFDTERNRTTDGKGYTYNQAHLPVREQREAVGHAVRGVYLYTGMADIAKRDTDEELYNACRHIWNNIVHKKLYITGGIGATADGEAFSFDYDLPNDLAYCETCASIGLCFFAQRMLEIAPIGEYGDIIERAMYNCILAGMSESGKEFFYVNPLEVLPQASHCDSRKAHIKPVRQKWYGCACCPPNLARFLNSIGEYCAGENDQTVFIHQYIAGEYKLQNATVNISGDYLKDGKMILEVLPKKPICVAVRIPGWCKQAILRYAHTVQNGYAYMQVYKKAVITVEFTPEIRLVKCSNLVRANIGKAAVMRGAVVYCCEEADNGKNLQLLSLDVTKPMQYRDGCIFAHGYREQAEETLYQEYAEAKCEQTEIRLIPYYKWANRGENEMLVYLPVKNH